MADVLVIGATGTTGSLVAAFLRDRGVPVRPASRTHGLPGHVRFEWADPETHAPALSGVSAVYLVAPIGVAEPAPLVAPFLNEATRQGVRRVVLLSSSAVSESATGLGALHGLVRTSAPEWTILRPSWFMQNFAGDSLVLRTRDGEILSATGQGRVAFIDAGDIASVAGHALIDEVPHNTEHLLTGPEALSYTEVADAIARRTGRPLRHTAVTVDELARHFAIHGLSPDFATALAALDADISGGAEDRVTDAVERITGRPARTFRDFCAREIR